MYYIGIDIGSTASKVAVYDDKKNDFVELFIYDSYWLVWSGSFFTDIKNA